MTRKKLLCNQHCRLKSSHLDVLYSYRRFERERLLVFRDARRGEDDDLVNAAC